MKIFNFLPDGFKLKNLSSSKSKLNEFFEAIKTNVTKDNYELIYKVSVKCLRNPKFKVFFSENFKVFIKQKFGEVDLKFIENKLRSLPKPKHKKKRVRLFPKNKSILKSGTASSSHIYSSTGKNTKPIYNLSKH